MAVVLKFRRDTTDLNLYPGAGSGLRIQRWHPKMADLVYRRIPDYVTENMDFIADRDTQNNLAATMQSMDEMRYWAAMERVDQTVQHPVWLHAKMENESGERRAYVRNIEGNWRSDPIGGIGDGDSACSDALLRLNVERHPYWEEPTPQEIGLPVWTSSGVSSLFNYGTIVGDVPARVAVFRAWGYLTDTPLSRLWIGVRSTKIGTPGNFVPVWEAESGTAGTDCSASQTDYGASNDAAREVTFATQTGWYQRLRIWTNQVTSDLNDQIGRFLWLLRCKIDTGTTCEVYLKWGPVTFTSKIQGPTVEVDSDTYNIYEMGEAQAPGVSTQVMNEVTTADLLDYYCVEVWARRTVGNGSLWLDCLCPIPVDEGWLIMKTEDVQTSGSFWFLTLPSDEMLSYHGVNRGIRFPVDYSHNSFALPPGGGRLVVASASNPALDNIDYEMQIRTVKYYQRWVNLRGSE